MRGLQLPECIAPAGRTTGPGLLDGGGAQARARCPLGVIVSPSGAAAKGGCEAASFVRLCGRSRRAGAERAQRGGACALRRRRSLARKDAIIAAARQTPREFGTAHGNHGAPRPDGWGRAPGGPQAGRRAPLLSAFPFLTAQAEQPGREAAAPGRGVRRGGRGLSGGERASEGGGRPGPRLPLRGLRPRGSGAGPCALPALRRLAPGRGLRVYGPSARHRHSLFPFRRVVGWVYRRAVAAPLPLLPYRDKLTLRGLQRNPPWPRYCAQYSFSTSAPGLLLSSGVGGTPFMCFLPFVLICNVKKTKTNKPTDNNHGSILRSPAILGLWEVMH